MSNLDFSNVTKLAADENAFHAYRMLYYPVFGAAGICPVPAKLEVSKENVLRALTVNENLAKTPYALSDESLTVLAQVYQALEDYARENGKAFEDVAFDPATDAAVFMPDAGKFQPMYPDFPSQVLEMDEETFRTHQVLHYLSTYGVEMLAASFGIEGHVEQGWMPAVENTEKTSEDTTQIDKQFLELVVSTDKMYEFIKKELSRPMRMPEAGTALAVKVIENQAATSGEIEKLDIGFHENGLAMVQAAKDDGSAELEHVMDSVAQHPGDVLKAILHVIYKEEEFSEAHSSRFWQCVVKKKRVNSHLATKQKKAFCRSLEKFDVKSIASNIADGGAKTRFAVNSLSISRFGKKSLLEAADLVETGKVVSWNSSVESLWAAYENAVASDGDKDNAAAKALVSKYGERPGVLLRSLTRLLKHDVPMDVVTNEFTAHAGSYSLATLVRLAAISGALDAGDQTGWHGFSPEKTEAEAERARLLTQMNPIIVEAVKSKLAAAETPLQGKKVFVDDAGFSLNGSVVMPNDSGNTSDAYPPAGMAYSVPEDKVVRFFVFWDDRGKRVDVDSHFVGAAKDGSGVHIGWNSDYKQNGMVTSGDITHSKNAAEYLDVDMEEARSCNVSYVKNHLHIFSGAANWRDIDTAFAGALVVGNTDVSTAQYTGKNVIFHDDLTGEGRQLDYALIDVENSCVRLQRGAAMPFVRTSFTLAKYLDVLFEAQKVEVVDSREDADVVRSIGRSNNEDDICFIDEGFFIG